MEKALYVVFSNCIIVGGWGFPISIRVVSYGTASCSFINNSLFSTSAIYAMAFVMILHTLWMGPFTWGY